MFQRQISVSRPRYQSVHIPNRRLKKNSKPEVCQLHFTLPIHQDIVWLNIYCRPVYIPYLDESDCSHVDMTTHWECFYRHTQCGSLETQRLGPQLSQDIHFPWTPSQSTSKPLFTTTHRLPCQLKQLYTRMIFELLHTFWSTSSFRISIKLSRSVILSKLVTFTANTSSVLVSGALYLGLISASTATLC